jgi:hypothetical protein
MEPLNTTENRSLSSAELTDKLTQPSGVLSRSAALHAQRKPLTNLIENKDQLSTKLGRNCGLQIAPNRFGLPVLRLPINNYSSVPLSRYSLTQPDS